MLLRRNCVPARWLCCLRWIAYGLLLVVAARDADAQESQQKFPDHPVRPPAPPKHRGLEFMRRYCLDCHTGDAAEAGLDLNRFDSVAAMAGSRKRWSEILRRVRDGEMPPRESDIPNVAERRQFLAWVPTEFRALANETGIRPGEARMRRLNGTEYAATIRDLLGIPINAAQGLPSDGSGGEGFDNASETLFISPLHAEKYRDAAREALNYALANRNIETKSRGAGPPNFLALEPTADRDALATARQALEQFLPQAFRRPALEAEIDDYLELFSQSYSQSDSYVEGLRLALEAALVSPKFLFLMEEPNTATEPVQVSQYELASRLSYFLWASMPDEQLLRLAGEGRLRDKQVLEAELIRMVGGGQPPEDDQRDWNKQRRDDRVRYFAQSFVEQWLGTRALGREFVPDAVVGPYDSELQGGMKYEPIFFFDYVLSANRPILELLDSDYTFVQRKLARHYGIPGEFREQPRKADLPADSHRGGILGMGAILAITSYPHRTSPVLRGKWVLETILGSTAAPPPPNVPPLEEQLAAGTPTTLRAKLETHRRDPNCAGCHNRLDPLGFGLENFDVLGRWRTEQAGQPIDAYGQLSDGTSFNGPDELRRVLLERRDDFARNLTEKMLGYALGRGLINDDYITVDYIVEQLKRNQYSSQTLLRGIIHSVPFQFKAGTDSQTTVAISFENLP
jgi:hypothetical protein